METSAHRLLKQEAIRLLLRAGCSAAGVEVSCPIARHRVDAAGYIDALPRSRRNAVEYEKTGSQIGLRFSRGERAKTVIVECKQARSDFLTDSRDMGELLAERDRLVRVRAVLEEQIVKACEPQLRTSGSRLFPDLEEWDFAASRVGSYRAVLNDLRRLDERMHGESKFWMMAHYRLADWLYLAAPRGVIRSREVPPGWGLLEIDLGASAAGSETGFGLSLRIRAPELRGKPEHRQRLLRNIAVASTRHILRADVQHQPA
jgi:hypothetical protein